MISMERKIALETISTELPTKCGIATFNDNFLKWALKHPRVSSHKCNSLVDKPIEYPIEKRDFIREINKNNQRARNRAFREIIKDAKEFKKSDLAELGVVIQLELGLFEDQYGKDFACYLYDALHKNNITNITIMHTVLANPGDYEKGEQYEQVIRKAMECTDQGICMAPSAIDILIERYKAPREKLIYIPHGINKLDIPHTQKRLKKAYDSNGKTILLTGGFLSESKDIKTVLETLARFKKQGREGLEFLVIGITHPKLLEDSGETYRNSLVDYSKELRLKTLSIGDGEKDSEEQKKLGLKELHNHNLGNYDVIFFNRFLNDRDSLKAGVLADLRIIPNKGESQVSSGEIVRAIETHTVYIANKSTISQDLAKEGLGFVVEPGSVNSLYKSMDFYLSKSQEEKDRLGRAEATKGSKMYFEKTSRDIIDVLGSIMDHKRRTCSVRY